LSDYSDDPASLHESDLCASDINTDDIISSTTDVGSPEHLAEKEEVIQHRAPPGAVLKKRGIYVCVRACVCACVRVCVCACVCVLLLLLLKV